MDNNRIRKRTYQILEKAQIGDIVSYVCDVFILSLISLNILMIMLETIDPLSSNYKNAFYLFNLFSVIVFTIEYLLRLWVAVESDLKGSPLKKRIKHAFSLMAIIDLLSILPFYLSFLILDLRFLRALRLLRILRIFKIGRYSNSIGTMIRIFQKKRSDLLISLFLVVILLIVFANIIFFVENEAQPDLFDNSFHTMWWGIITMTGVGYGDMVPITLLGKIIGGIISVFGIVIVALPVGILSAAYVEDLENKLHGKIKVIRSSDHIIICGYSSIVKSIAAEILNEDDEISIILVSSRENPDIPGIIYVNADWTDLKCLEQVNIEKAKACIIISEDHTDKENTLDHDVIDMRTLFTLYKIKQKYPDIHTVAEVINPDRLDMIKTNIEGDEIVLKEVIDGNLIANCIKIPGVSLLINELLNREGNVIQETTLSKLGLADRCLYRDVITHGIETDINYIGYISGEENIAKLSPSKHETIKDSDRLIFLAHKKEKWSE